MARITTVICALLIVSAVIENGQALSINGSLDVVKDAMIATIDKGVELLKRQIHNIEDFAHNAIEKVHEVEELVRRQVHEQYEQLVQKLNDHVAEISAQHPQCAQTVESFKIGYDKLSESINVCVDSVSEESSAHINKVDDSVKKTFDNLSSYKEDAQKCTENVNSISDSVKAIGCLHSVGAKATWSVTKEIPLVLVELAKVVAWPVKVAQCSGNKVYGNLQEKYDYTVAQINKCIHSN